MDSDGLHRTYHGTVPDFITEIASTPPMLRLRHIGMNCGCEYTSLHIFRNIGRYSRYDHSIGAALIVWHFTGDVRQSVAALLHDISTPVFAHVVDFLHGDHMKQESTEKDTASVISGSPELVSALGKYGLKPEDVSDYHMFPIADNDTPKLSSDRLEYTCGNILHYGFGDLALISRLYAGIRAGRNECGEQELVFDNPRTASEFAELSLACSKVYVCDADRFAMQRLAEILADAVTRGVIRESDLDTTEEAVIERLLRDDRSKAAWNRFISYDEVRTFPACGTSLTEPAARPAGLNSEARIIYAKKRHINPYVPGVGRVTGFNPDYDRALREFLSADFGYYVYGTASV